MGALVFVGLKDVELTFDVGGDAGIRFILVRGGRRDGCFSFGTTVLVGMFSDRYDVRFYQSRIINAWLLIQGVGSPSLCLTST
jgi:hypothetical protein